MSHLPYQAGSGYRGSAAQRHFHLPCAVPPVE
ncbi:Uncharacterised protein [Vibrio cholerae]|nr:Uncharacterised protein [Vibrio cholerae]